MAYLKSKGIPFKDVDVSQDAAAAQWVMDKIGYIATPIIDVAGSIVMGFDRPALDAALKAHKFST